MKALKILKTIQNKVVRKQDATKDINALRKEIELIPKDRTNEILDFVKKSNTQMDNCVNYIHENLGMVMIPMPSHGLLDRYGMDYDDRVAVVLAVLEDYFKLKENQK